MQFGSVAEQLLIESVETDNLKKKGMNITKCKTKMIVSAPLLKESGVNKKYRITDSINSSIKQLSKC